MNYLQQSAMLKKLNGKPSNITRDSLMVLGRTETKEATDQSIVSQVTQVIEQVHRDNAQLYAIY